MAFIDRWMQRISLTLAVVAGLALLAIAGTIMAEIVMRALRRPLIGAIEIVRVTFVISVFFAFAHVITQGREIRVDILRNSFPPLLAKLLDILASLVTAAFFALLLWFSVFRLQDNWTRGVYLEGRLLLPMWIPWATITVGAALSVVAALLAAVKHALGRPVPGPG